MGFLQNLRAAFSGNDSSENVNLNTPFSLDVTYDDNSEKLIVAYEKKHFNRLQPEERYFRSDQMLKRCVVALASYATLTVGFDTVLEPPSPFKSEEEEAAFNCRYEALKAYCDAANKRVNMEDIAYTAVVKLALYGKAAFEIASITDEGGKVRRVEKLVKLPVYNSRTDGVQPKIEKGNLKGYVLRVKDDKEPLFSKKELRFSVEKVLYFVNNDVDGDLQGISDVQELIPTCIVRAALDRESPAILKRIHDPYVIASVDTDNTVLSGETVEEQKAELKAHLCELLDGVDCGRSVVTNNKVTATVMQLKIDLQGLIAFDEKSEDKIIAHFGVPRFLVNRPNVNRATAETEFKAFVSGTVAAKQRVLKRVLEAGWYDMLTRKYLQEYEGLAEDAPLPVRVKHVWRSSEVGDFKEKVEAAVALYGDGAGLLGDNPELALQLSGIYNDKVKEHFDKQTKLIDERTKNPTRQ